jgi:hypothetical protein
MKIRYIDEDDMHLVVAEGNPVLIQKGDIKEFSEEMANSFLRDTKTIIKKGKIVKIPKWELVKEKKEGK